LANPVLAARLRAISLVVAATLPLAVLAGAPAQAQQRGADPFAAACMAGGKRSAANCACQSKIARANLNAREQRAALAAMRGDKTGFGREIKAMGPNGAKAFDAKKGKLGQLSRSRCGQA